MISKEGITQAIPEPEVLNFDNLIHCIDAEVKDQKNNDFTFSVTFSLPQPRTRIQACLKNMNIPWNNDFISEDLVQGICINSIDDKFGVCGKEKSILEGRTISHANIYVASNDIFKVKEDIESFQYADISNKVGRYTPPKRKAFQISREYANALQRFSFLTNVLGWLTYPLLFSSLLLLFFLLFLQISTVIEHRKKQYGILLAKGFRFSELWAMTFTQTLLATVLAYGLACVIYLSGRYYINTAFGNSEAASVGQNELGINAFFILPNLELSWLFLVPSGVFLLSAIILTIIFLWRLPLLLSTEPIDLFR